MSNKEKGSEYDWFGKSSSNVSFDQAFANARKSGLKIFEWNGKKYTTELAKKPEKFSPVKTASYSGLYPTTMVVNNSTPSSSSNNIVIMSKTKGI